MKVNLSLYCEKTFCLHNIWCAQNKNYATMGVWERMPLRSHSLLLFPPQPRRLPGYIRRTSASAHTSGPEGCALHAATSPFTGIRQCAPKATELTPRKDGGMRNLGRGGIRRLTERGRDRKFKSCRFLIPATQERLTGPEKVLDARLSWRRKRWQL